MPFTRICCVPVEWMNFCIIDEVDARDKVTYQKSLEQRNNIRCVWLVRTSNYTNCNWSHTLWKTLIIHEVRLVESQCFQSIREFSWCYIWNCILSSVAIFQTGYVPCSSSVGYDISLKLQRRHHVAVASTLLIKL